MGDIEVAVPDGLEPGNPFLVQLAGGQQVQIIVPPGCYAGAVLSVQLPELAELLPPAPVAVEMPEGTLVPGASLVEASPADAHAPLVPMPSVEERLELMRAPSSSSGFHGVTKQSSGGKQFLAQIRVDGKQRKLGRFETVEEAAMAYAVAMGPADVARLRDLSSRHATSISPEAALARPWPQRSQSVWPYRGWSRAGPHAAHADAAARCCTRPGGHGLHAPSFSWA